MPKISGHPHDWLKDVIPTYFKIVVRDESTDPSKLDTSTLCSEINQSKADQEQKCCGTDCRKRLPSGCSRRMCYACCCAKSLEDMNTDLCILHRDMREKELETDRRINEIIADMEGKRDFNCAEDKLTKVGQTVVIWCLKDFLNNKRWSADTFERIEREQRKQALYKRRLEHHENIIMKKVSKQSQQLPQLPQQKPQQQQQLEDRHIKKEVEIEENDIKASIEYESSINMQITENIIEEPQTKKRRRSKSSTTTTVTNNKDLIHVSSSLTATNSDISTQEYTEDKIRVLKFLQKRKLLEQKQKKSRESKFNQWWKKNESIITESE